MSTDPFTELLWNHLCVPRQMSANGFSPLSALSHGSSNHEGLARPDDAVSAGQSLSDLGTLPQTLAAAPTIDPTRMEAASGALAYIREVHAFINAIQHTAEEMVVSSPAATSGSNSLDMSAMVGMTGAGAAPVTDTATPHQPFSTAVPPAANNDAALPDQGDGGSTDEGGPDASQYMWIGNEAAAAAIAEACFIDPGLANVMNMARTTIQSVTPGAEGISAILDAAATHINWNAQFNILHDGDSASQSLTVEAFDTPDALQVNWQAASQTVSVGGNSSVNEASVQGSDPGYDLIIVTGNYYEYNIVLQVNIVFDNDLIRQLFGVGAHDGSYEGTASAGGNSSVNEAGVVKAGLGAPLLLGGDYYYSDTLVQYSFLSDMDVLKAAAVMLGMDGTESSYDLLQSILTGGNSQQNGLSLYDVGSNANIWSLESLNAFKLAFFTGESSLGALLMLEDGEQLAPGTLYVDGDYAEVNVLIQVNVVFDSDTIDQEAMAGGHAGQNAVAGANTANNSAYIIDAGSSAVLVVAGDYYESNTVIQANFIQDNDTIFQEAEVSSPQHIAASANEDATTPHVLTDSLYSMSA